MARVQGPNGKLGAGLISVWAQELPNIHYGAGISFSSRAPGRRGLTDIARPLQSVSRAIITASWGSSRPGVRRLLSIGGTGAASNRALRRPLSVAGKRTVGPEPTKGGKGPLTSRELPMQTASYALVPLLPASCRVLPRPAASSTRPDARGALQKRAPTSTFVPYTSWRWRELNPLVPVLRGAAQRVEIWRDVRKYTTVLTRL